eukprot:TRINITY_DN65997_c0_g1_i1.p2 TRINITY_DN65997_c0_g1~~TRINITY_DN65997_c0_g1_i1.p2  ORF type:complete len:403 (+),score=137.30 TRINITY_DN65997_c0_g1_i1:55-1263(+)
MSRSLENALIQVDSGDRSKLRQDVTEVLGGPDSSSPSTLRAKYDEAQQSLLLNGTLKTVHNGESYHTPVSIQVRNYPRQPPLMRVVPTDTMSPNTSASGYRMSDDGTVVTAYADSWSPSSTLAGFVNSAVSKFNAEAPLFMSGTAPAARPPTGVEGRVAAYLGNTSTAFASKDRVARDAVAALQAHPTLHLCTDDGLTLQGTLPAKHKGAVYHIPVSLKVPVAYPAGEEGVPDVRVCPSENMKIKPYHKHVDSTGKVFVPCMWEWDAARHSLMTCAEQVVESFSSDPPVVSVVKRNAGHQSRSPSRSPATSPSARTAQTKQATEAARQRIKEKVCGFEPTPAEEDEKMCLACLSNKKDVLLIPCRHLCLCGACVEVMCDGTDPIQCPICRCDVDDVFPGVYF